MSVQGVCAQGCARTRGLAQQHALMCLPKYGLRGRAAGMNHSCACSTSPECDHPALASACCCVSLVGTLLLFTHKCCLLSTCAHTNPTRRHLLPALIRCQLLYTAPASSTVSDQNVCFWIWPLAMVALQGRTPVITETGRLASGLGPTLIGIDISRARVLSILHYQDHLSVPCSCAAHTSPLACCVCASGS